MLHASGLGPSSAQFMAQKTTSFRTTLGLECFCLTQATEELVRLCPMNTISKFQSVINFPVSLTNKLQGKNIGKPIDSKRLNSYISASQCMDLICIQTVK